ncbi:hypothetical protein HMPREF9999_00732 [Alloprevotella sp. oral taxon 473 str. F0040]|nr:hypothetical protein HMPREF9999_00732 [Alloprevotella sp. oral taxon 473 str. F0040]
MTEQVTRKDSFLFLAILEGALREEGTFFFWGDEKIAMLRGTLGCFRGRGETVLKELVLKFYP